MTNYLLTKIIKSDTILSVIIEIQKAPHVPFFEGILFFLGESILNQKERLEQIRQKHEREQRKRKILIHRIIFASAAIVIILLIIFGIKSCVSSVSERAEQKRQAEIAAQTTPEPTQASVVTNPNEISAEYYANSAFVGNSFIEGLLLYDMVDGADYFSKIGLNVNDAMTKSTDTGTVPVIDELNSGKQYSKIFMMFGENELGWINPDTFISQYGALIDKAKTYQPDSKIYLLAIKPVTKKVSDENIDNTTNEQILKYNDLIKQLAQDKGVIYADIHSAVVGSDGALPEGAASDGVHFGEEYYKKCLLYIQNNNL